MSKTTAIQWCHSTVNPVMGCDGCELWDLKQGIKRCYAGILTERYAGQRNSGFPESFDKVKLFPGRMAEAKKWGPPTPAEQAAKPWLPKDRRVIFISDMGDALSSSVEFEFLKSEIIDVVSGTPHIWMWLTKRAGRLAEFDFWLHSKDIKWPDNLWGGTSVTSAASARRVIDLAGTRIATLFVSGEPQKEFIDPASIVGRDRISLWIQGGASGIGAERFDVQWARAWRDWCRATGANYFLKQLGAHATYAGNRMPLSHSHGGDWNEWPHDLRVRQFPGVRTL